MAALGLDLTGNTAPEKVITDNHSEDDADSDFDDGGSQKRRPRVHRAEDLEDGAEPPANAQKQPWELSPPKGLEADPWAEPANQTGDAPSNEPPKNHERKGSKPKNTRGNSDSRGVRGGPDSRGGRGASRGRGSGERGRGTGERGRGTFERGRGTNERGRGGRGRGRGGSVPTKKEEVSSEAKSPAAEKATDGWTVPQDDAEAAWGIGSNPNTGEEGKEQGKSSSSTKQAAEAWELPPVSPAEQEVSWGVSTSDSAQPAQSPQGQEDGGWGESNGNKKNADGNKQVKRPPAYHNPDRVKTGGTERVSLMLLTCRCQVS